MKRLLAFPLATLFLIAIVGGCSPQTEEQATEAVDQTGQAIESAAEDAADVTEGAVEGAAEAADENDTAGGNE
jgi:hypothetical protein